MPERFNVQVSNPLWERLSAEDRRQVDELVAAGRSIQAIALMRERADLPRPDLRDCVDLLELRAQALCGR
ncbi:hypothetical protein GTW46_12915 [Streptomyces sp. SID6013]|uniref:hypothetical protein n=1 Tax=Streptomyces coelicoflavus TaxID=285562 RepID=UPI00138261D3|nr:hypothetical protein [Streptomyces sp. SID6013]